MRWRGKNILSVNNVHNYKPLFSPNHPSRLKNVETNSQSCLHYRATWVLCTIQGRRCAQHNFLVHQRMNANGFLTTIWFILLKQINKWNSTRDHIIRNTTGYVYNGSYSVHNGALILCWARLLCLLSSWERLTVFAVQYQLLTSSPARGALSPFSPYIQDGPISPRVHAHLCPHVCYRRIGAQTDAA